MSEDDDDSFEVLLQRARNGDSAALWRLIESRRAELARVALRLGVASNASMAASDVVQETSVKAFERFTTFEGNDERTLSAWLRTILKNLVSNLRTKQAGLGRRLESLEESPQGAGAKAPRDLVAAGSTPSAQVSRREQAVLTLEALESLPLHYQQILVLSYQDKVPHEEICRRMNLRTEGASRMLLMRAAKALEKRLREQA